MGQDRDNRRGRTGPDGTGGAVWPQVAGGVLAPMRLARAHPKVAAAVLAAAVGLNWAAGYTRAGGWALVAALVLVTGSCLMAAHRVPAGGRGVWRWLGALAVAVCAAVAARVVSVVVAPQVAAVAGAVLAGVWWLLDTIGAAGRAPVRRGRNSHYNADGSAKVEYATRSDAVAAGERLSARDGAHMSAYRCAEGRHWHVGHTR